MAERGRETMISGGHIEGDGPTYFGLWNVAVACHEDPRGERAWAKIVARHADVVTAAASTNIDDELAMLCGKYEKKGLDMARAQQAEDAIMNAADHQTHMSKEWGRVAKMEGADEITLKKTPELIAKECNRVIHLEHGRIVETTPEAVQ